MLGIIRPAVTIKNIECAIGEVGWERGLNVPRPVPANMLTGKRIAIVGSGPSGLACAAQLIKVVYSTHLLAQFAMIYIQISQTLLVG